MGKLNFIPRNVELTKEKFIQLEEQYIFKQIEELGYEYQICLDGCQFVNRENRKVIVIDKKQKRYAKCDTNGKWVQFITLEEHQLLHKLFELWGWLDA